MRDRITLLIAIVLLAIVTATSYWYSRVMRRPDIAEPPRPGTPDFVVERVVLTQFDEQGRARHKLFGKELRHFAETDDIEVTAPRLVSLRADQPRVEVSARSAHVEGAGERVQLNGDVLISREAAPGQLALKVATQSLWAFPDEDRYTTDQPVEIQRGASRIFARGGMKFDNLHRSIELEGGTTGSFVRERAGR